MKTRHRGPQAPDIQQPPRNTERGNPAQDGSCTHPARSRGRPLRQQSAGPRRPGTRRPRQAPAPRAQAENWTQGLRTRELPTPPAVQQPGGPDFPGHKDSHEQCRKRKRSSEDVPRESVKPLKRSRSYEFIPPDMSELRIVLLGGSWSERISVGNFILGVNAFNKKTQSCLRFSGTLKEENIVVINTPDLQFPTAEKLTEFLKDCRSVSDPGPHVFLLVLQPENFIEEQKDILCRVLQRFNDQSFNHSLILILPPRQKRSGLMKDYMKQPLLKEMIRKCRYRYLMQKNLELPELLTRCGQIVKENNGGPVEFEESTDSLSDDHQSLTQRIKPGSIMAAVKDAASDLRVVLLGKSEKKKTELSNLITGQQRVHHQKYYPTKHCVSSCGEWRRKPVTVIKTPDLFSLSEEDMRRKMKECESLCPPGPNVLLLLVKPSDLTENDRKSLKFILSLFGEDVFRYSMVIITHENEMNDDVSELLRECAGRQYNMVHGDHRQLMEEIENIVQENKGRSLILTEGTRRPKSEMFNATLNLVVFGRRGAGKASAVMAILGWTELCSVSSSSKCVKHQGEVCGRWLSLVEMPALYGKPQEAVMEESFRCVSLCDPEGVHAFILVLPVGPLTDEDNRELQTIQKTFGSRVNDFLMILFTVESDPAALYVDDFIRENRNIQELLKSCGGRSVVLNIKDKQQVPELLDTVEKNIPGDDKLYGYTTKTFIFGKMEEVSQLQADLQESRTKTNVTGADEQLSSECLRIVLIGRTGSGKSRSGNTILGSKSFESKSTQQSVTKNCQKGRTVVDGRPVAVVDTPDLLENSLSNNQLIEEMVKCMSLLAPGPHVFLLVLQIGRFKPVEKDTLQLIKKVFGTNSEKFTIILFTRGDDLEDEELSIEDYIENRCEDSFKKLLSDCGGRYHVFNNRDKQKRSQVSELIRKIDTMVTENGGSCFTNEMLQEAEAAIRKEMERLLKEKEEMKRQMEELEHKHEKEKEEMKNIEEQTAAMEKERKQKARQLNKKEKTIKKELEQRKREQETREQEEKKRKEKEDRQQQKWEHEREALGEKIRSQLKKKKIDRKLEQSRKEMEERRKAWEKEQKEWWENRQREDEERRQEDRKLEKLQEEFKQEREKYEKKRKEDDEKRKELEKERQELEENYKKQLEDMKKKHEDKARRQAEELNDFQEKYKDLETLMRKHNEEQKALKEKLEKEIQEKQQKDQEQQREITEKEKILLEKQETEINKLEDLKNRQEQELKNLRENFVVKHCTIS